MIAALLLTATPAAFDGVTFANRPNETFVMARNAAAKLGRRLEYDAVTQLATLDGEALPVDLPRLFGGSLLLPSSKLNIPPAQVRVGAKRVFVDLRKQEVWAYQGALVVMHSPISSGRALKDTPPGDYRTGKKEKMHISSIYGSEMPFSVHLKGNYFIHGSEVTLSTPGSHGCVRLPLYNGAAQWFFDWVDTGTDVRVRGKRETPNGLNTTKRQNTQT